MVKPHGLRGEVVVDPWTDLPDRFVVGTVLVVGDVERTLVGSRPHQGRLLLQFEDVPDRTAAELLRGAVILADAVEADDLDVYLADELLGLPVRRDDGLPLGVVSAFIELPPAAGYDLLEVELDGRTWLLPATDEYVEVEDHEDGPVALVVTDPPEGLLPEVDDD